MKNLLNLFLVITLATGFAIPSFAQDSGRIPLTSGKIEPYKMNVTYDKTSHIIFPAAIRYVDLGSEYLIAGKAEGAANVLRIKASVRDFEPETNFSVITDDGRFYNFDVYYNPHPGALSYDLTAMQKEADKTGGSEVYFEELGGTSSSLAGLIMGAIYWKNKRIARLIRTKSLGVQFTLKGIYIHDGKYYLHTEINNQTNVPFDIDFINFKIADKKVAKRTVAQERPIVPLKAYRPLGSIGGNMAGQNIFLLDQFTIASDQLLLIKVFEKNGGRHQTLQVKSSDLIKARLINEMKMKF